MKLILCGNNGNSVFLGVAWDRYLGTGVCNVFAHSGSELSTMLCFLMVGIIIIKMIVSV